MGIMLTEGVVDWMLKQYQDNLLTHVAAVNTDRADSNDLPVLAAEYRYFNYEKSPSPDQVEVQVFAPGNEILNWNSALATVGVSSLLQQRVTTVTRIVQVNRDALHASELQQRAHRFAAALVLMWQALSVISDDRYTPTIVNIEDHVGVPDAGEKRAVEVRATIEVMHLESSASSGVPAGATIETT